ncbi:hybrid sensor histidine kinase/response regulator [Acaryochloris sp. IP29b_bin.137]|uniref:hybrid sensor histidine kinase/response regulator n=1 Tax=Acaryochloris sp. IP29b_bin.137 TaxID=2969217 RepID=UPI002608491B|nr:hybrid sensor histidine kinase/response regulator [Acaryochloris sp. IP29b_bin.137]
MSHSQIILSNYQVREKLYESSRTLVYRADNLVTQENVVLKLLKAPYPTAQDLAEFRNEYNIHQDLNLPGIVKPNALLPYHNGFAIEMPDFGGISLAKLFIFFPQTDAPSDGTVYPSSLPLNIFLDIAIQLAASLENLRQHRIIHKDIKPQNIVVHPQTLETKLIDFGLSSKRLQESSSLLNPKLWAGTFAYLSPEQTGRMNRKVDYRTDFYSLGVTFYELLTGQLPFPANDPMELVHCHIAQRPVAPAAINSEIPEVLNQIILKLMAKMPEERYQTGYGLKFDLEQCRHQLQQQGSIHTFGIGMEDQSEVFVIPEKLYGRDSEVEILLNTFERVAQGTTELMLVSGQSGVGKTAVIGEIHKPVVRRRGYFIQGKFDPLKQSIPFSALLQALRHLCQQLLMESQACLKRWQTKILDAVGNNGQVMIDVIPEVELLIGPQPPVVELGPEPTLNRFNFVFQQFFQVFPSIDHPLVLFLDDLQWIDSASLTFLKNLLEEAKTGYLLLLGAYRDNEVLDAHPLKQTLKQIESTHLFSNKLHLTALKLRDLNVWVADTLASTPEQTHTLTEHLFHKTKGNPFFCRQFLQTLRQEDLIRFDKSHRVWEWDITQIQALAPTDDVVEFVRWQLLKLSPQTQDFLKFAACIGNPFSQKTLALIAQFSEEETTHIVGEALQAGLLEEVKSIKLPDTVLAKRHKDHLPPATNLDSPEVTEYRCDYKFLHDRVQQAAYSLIPPGQKRATHLAIGRQLLNTVPEIEGDEQIFELVNQLNRGATLIKGEVEKVRLAELNKMAAQQARASTAYDLAAEYASMGLILLGSRAWQDHYALMLSLSELAAEAAYLHGAISKMEKLVASILTHTTHPLDQVRAYEIQIQAYTSQHRLLDALATAQQALECFGIVFPEAPDSYDLQQAFQDLAQQTALDRVAELVNLPEMTDPEQLAVMGIAASMIPVAYIAAPHLFPLVTIFGVKTSLLHGNSPLGGFFYATYSILLTGILQDIESAKAYSHLALQVVEKFDAKPVRPSVLYSLGAFVVHDTAHLQDAIAMLREGYQIALDTGNLEFVGYCAKDICQYSYFKGQNLTTLETDIQAYVKLLEKYQLVTTASFSRLFLQVVLNLQRTDLNPTQLVGEAFNENESVPDMLSANNMAGLHFYSVHKLVLGVLFQDRQNLQSLADEARVYLEGGPGYFTGPIFRFYESLALLALSSSGTAIPADWLQRISENQADLKRRLQFNPANYQHKYHLVEAEHYCVVGAHLDALEAYDQAIALATEHNFVQELALAQELAARFYLQWGKTTIAQTYMVNAYYTYERWGATAKLADLEDKFSQLLAPFLNSGLRIQALESFSMARTQPTHSSHGGFQGLDWAAVMKACQALSEEIEIERLLATTLQVVIKNAGAERGSLFMKQNQQMCLMAQYPQTSALLPISLDHIEIDRIIPLSLVHYSERTLETFVIHDGRTEPKFAGDPYQEKYAPLSQLCMPIVRQGELVGLLYLENNLTPGAFTSDHLEVLHLLTAQAAISIDNAQLYSSVENKIAQRTQQLRTAQLEAEKANQAKSKFLASMSHELRTPLNAILGFSQLMAQDVSLPRHLQESLEIINRSGEHLLDLINDVLALSKIEAGKTTLQLDTFNLYEFLQAIQGMLQLKAQAKGIELRFEQSSDVPEIIQADEQKLRQILINLLGNAIKFTEIGWVALRVRRATPSLDKGGQSPPDISVLMFEVEDTGAGIAANELGHVFEAFVQTKTGVRSQQGTGLGLPISQSFVQLMGGKLQVRSEEGIGTCFYFDLPVLLTEVRVTPIRPKRRIIGLAEGQPTQRILVVEDQADNQRLLIDHLSPLGFVVTAVSEGQSAIQCWQSWHPHLIFMDLQLPGMGGRMAAQEIKRLAAAGRGPVPIIIALTANAFDDVRNQALANGCDGFVSKPYMLADLLELMARSLDLEWIYEDSAPSEPICLPGRSLTPEHLSDLPATWKEQLNQAAMFLDEGRATALIADLEGEHQEIAASLYQLVKDYQFEQLIQLTRSV